MKCLLAFLFTIFSASAGIIPASRLGSWTVGTSVGVPGGIPERATIFVNVLTATGGQAAYRCAGDGVTDDTVPLNAAMHAARTLGQTVYLPAANYKVSGTILDQFASDYTVRGDGMGLTKLTLSGGTGKIEIGTEQFPLPAFTTGGFPSYPTTNVTPALSVTAGATAGSTTITVASTSTVTIGNFIQLAMTTPSWIHSLNPGLFGPDSNNFVLRITLLVASKTGTTVTFSPAIPYDFSGMTPMIIPWGKLANGSASTGHVTSGVGFEDLTIDATAGAIIPFKNQQAWGCWLKRVEVTGTLSRQFFLDHVSMSEVVGCYTHNTQGTGPNHEGIDLLSDNCWNYLYDNVCVNGGRPAICIGDGQGGCVGNVIAYNYIVPIELGGNEVWQAGIGGHGSGGNGLNLFEGNDCEGISDSDGYYGGSWNNTYARNHFHNQSINDGPIAMNIGHHSVNFNVVGNVLGCLNVTGKLPQTANLYDTELSGAYRSLVYRTGFPNVSAPGYSGTITATTPPNYVGLPMYIANSPSGNVYPLQQFIANASTDVITVAVPAQPINGLVAGATWVPNQTTGTLPGGLTLNTTYYVKTVTGSNTFTISDTNGGAFVDITSTGTGNHYWTPLVPVDFKIDLNVKNTLIRHGNRIQSSGFAEYTEFEADNSRGTGVDFSDHIIPNSYYLSGIPSWWPGGLTWPPIDGIMGTRGLIPAEVRYTGQPIGAPASGGRKARGFVTRFRR